MAISLYMDHNVPRVITIGLRLRKIDVLTAYEDHRSQSSDSELLDRAYEFKKSTFFSG